MRLVTLSLGSNIEREHHITVCLDALADTFGQLAVSRVFESTPVGFEDGRNFFNLVVALHCDWSVGELQAWCKRLESANGRSKDSPKFSPRTLDVDILTVDSLTGEVDGVCLHAARSCTTPSSCGRWQSCFPTIAIPSWGAGIRSSGKRSATAANSCGPSSFTGAEKRYRCPPLEGSAPALVKARQATSPQLLPQLRPFEALIKQLSRGKRARLIDPTRQPGRLFGHLHGQQRQQGRDSLAAPPGIDAVTPGHGYPAGLF